MLNENTGINDIDLALVDKEIIEKSLSEVQNKYLNCFINIELYNYLIRFMESEIDNEETEEAKNGLRQAIESQRQQKLATIKMIENHRVNILSLQSLISKY